MVQKLVNPEEKLLETIDLIPWKINSYLNEVKVIKQFNIQKREDYVRYDKLSRDIRIFANKLKVLDPSSDFRAESCARLLEKLYLTGLISSKWNLSHAANVSASSFCRRRLPVIMVRNKMSENLKEATKLIEQGHIQVGTEVVRDPAFLVSRALEESLTWVVCQKNGI